MTDAPEQGGFRPEIELPFRDELREARASALRDAEGFHDIVLCLERLGYALTEIHDHYDGMNKYQPLIAAIAERSPLATDIPDDCGQWHIPFFALYDSVRVGRNDAFHQGAYARHLTTHAVELSLILEDALMSDRNRLGDFMVRDPVCAYPWQPISFIRQTLLVNSFSYLPVRLDDAPDSDWQLVSDYAVAHYLRRFTEAQARREALARTLGQAISSGGITLLPASMYHVDSSITDVLQQANGSGVPVLVCRQGTHDLLGIVTPFDLL